MTTDLYAVSLKGGYNCPPHFSNFSLATSLFTCVCVLNILLFHMTLHYNAVISNLLYSLLEIIFIYLNHNYLLRIKSSKTNKIHKNFN